MVYNYQRLEGHSLDDATAVADFIDVNIDTVVWDEPSAPPWRQGPRAASATYYCIQSARDAIIDAMPRHMQRSSKGEQSFKEIEKMNFGKITRRNTTKSISRNLVRGGRPDRRALLRLNLEERAGLRQQLSSLEWHSLNGCHDRR